MVRPELCILVVFLLATTPIFAKDFWNIDCGGNETFVNAESLTYEGDAPYINTGISRVAPNGAANAIPREISSMRVFQAAPWKKSCYRVPVEQGTKVLVRAQFYYGNYDGLNSPPSFMATFGTTDSCDVTLTSDLDYWSFYEAVYTTTEKLGTDICFIRTKADESPIVSSIQVVRLKPKMYHLLDFSLYTLLLVRRFAFGANETIRYPDDAYDRIWQPNDLQGIEGAGRVHKPVIGKRESRSVLNAGVDENPPVRLFDAAVVAPMVGNQTAANLTIQTVWLSSETTSIYWTMYFAELLASSNASSQQKRTFNIYKDGEQQSNASDPIQPNDGFVTVYSGSRYRASNSTVFDLVSATGSILLPLINGMELFIINDIVKATDINDVVSLSRLQNSFTILKDWTGDPCLPADYNWEWLGCMYPDMSSPRVNKLLLSGYELSGTIPNFSSLDALEVIDLSNNSFTGSIPEFLASLPNLQKLNVSENDFDSIPSSLRDNTRILLITSGNPRLDAQGPPPLGKAGSTYGSNGASVQYRVSSSMLILFVLLLIADLLV